ncbi:MAG: anti-sigma factor [Vicinamibacterales bacterium]
MTCREFIDFIMNYLDGELPTEVQTPFERHLSRCPACERYLRQYRATIAAGKAAYADDAGDVPGDVPEELVTAILESRRARPL